MRRTRKKKNGGRRRPKKKKESPWEEKKNGHVTRKTRLNFHCGGGGGQGKRGEKAVLLNSNREKWKPIDFPFFDGEKKGGVKEKRGQCRRPGKERGGRR